MGFFFMVVQNYSYMKVPGYLRLILDEISGANRWSVILPFMIYILLYTLLLGVTLFLMRKLIIGVSRKIEYQLREKLFHKILSQEYLFFQKNETGDLISRCTNDLNQVRTLLGPGVMYIPNSLSRLFLFLPVLIHLSSTLMLWMGAIMVILVITIIRLLPLLRPYFRQIQEAMGSMNNRVWQVISGITCLKQYTAEDIELHRFKELNQEYIKKQMAVAKLEAVFRPLFFFLLTLSELVILWKGGNMVINHQMSMGELLQFTVMVSYLTFPIISLGWMMSLMQQGISALKRINYIFDYPVQDTTLKKAYSESQPILTLRNLTYHYPDHSQEVLHDINLTITPGHTIGITGPVGCGKTTLINILSGLLRPEPGEMFVNSDDICDLRLDDFYRHVAVVSQEPFLFSKTVAQNIALGPQPLSDEVIHTAAENAGLQNDIQAFYNHYDQEIGERGITLSGGQKQRVAIARALAKCAPILIMDDPLSNVDSRTEELILENLHHHHCFKTLILVSHRISVLKKADVIYVLANGTIVEHGNHGGLMKQNGLYTRLARLQQMELDE